MAHAERIGLDTLVEAHDRDELARAVRLDAPVIGINARDLQTFAIDRRSQLDIVADAAHGEAIVIAESAVHSRAQAAAAELAGADAVLVGTSLMRAQDPGSKLRELVSRPLVKVCGLTRQEDVDAAVEAGADLLGFIFVDRSPRRAEAVLDVPETALSVAVYVGERGGHDADLTQFYPDDDGTVRGRRAEILRGDEHVATLLDQPWQGEDPGHWRRARETEGRIVLAGGLGPDNVRAAIEAVHPWAVDAASSLESAPGIKDHDKVRAYVEAAHA
jgi:phosphoribosylanthranilate isomerase